MRRHGRNAQEERLVRFYGVVEEAESLGGEDVGGVLALIADRRVLVALVGGVEVAVRERVEEEIGARPAGWEGAVIVCDVVGVEELSRVVGVVAGVL